MKPRKERERHVTSAYDRREKQRDARRKSIARKTATRRTK